MKRALPLSMLLAALAFTGLAQAADGQLMLVLNSNARPGESARAGTAFERAARSAIASLAAHELAKPGKGNCYTACSRAGACAVFSVKSGAIAGEDILAGISPVGGRSLYAAWRDHLYQDSESGELVAFRWTVDPSRQASCPAPVTPTTRLAGIRHGLAKEISP